MEKRLIFNASSPMRLDVYLTAEIGISRSKIKQMIIKGLVNINGEPAKKAGMMLEGEEVIDVIADLSPKEIELVGNDKGVDIVFEDEHLAVIEKPYGIAVHPGAGGEEDTMVHRLLGHFKTLGKGGGSHRPGIVHRLDKDTHWLDGYSKK